MSKTVKLRSGRDRLRYTILFEAVLFAMLIPAGTVFFDKGLADIGVLGAVLLVKAVLLGLLYNWVFDKFDARSGRVSSERKLAGRIVHAVGFELTLLVTSVPLYCWWLNITVVEAVMVDIVVTSLVVAYTYLFTLAYDRLFLVATRFRSPISMATELRCKSTAFAT